MNIGKTIKNAGLKATPQRKMIYELMTKLGHSTIDEIIAGVQQQSSEFTVSTVYRILESFCNAGLVSKMSHPNGKCFYDVTLEEHCHVFMNNEITDYIDSDLLTLIKNRLKEKSFKYLDSIEKISLQIVVKQ